VHNGVRSVLGGARGAPGWYCRGLSDAWPRVLPRDGADGDHDQQRKQRTGE
jgi:hypothetical protein